MTDRGDAEFYFMLMEMAEEGLIEMTLDDSAGAHPGDFRWFITDKGTRWLRAERGLDSEEPRA